MPRGWPMLGQQLRPVHHGHGNQFRQGNRIRHDWGGNDPAIDRLQPGGGIEIQELCQSRRSNEELPFGFQQVVLAPSERGRVRALAGALRPSWHRRPSIVPLRQHRREFAVPMHGGIRHAAIRRKPPKPAAEHRSALPGWSIPECETLCRATRNAPIARETFMFHTRPGMLIVP